VPRYFLQLAYNGAAYHGWQVQNNAHTVQAELNKKIGLLLGEEINLVGCGRTDTGVNARDFYAHLDTNESIRQTYDINDFLYRLNKFLPPDIVVFRLKLVPDSYHARFDAISRTYRYYISRKKNPFMPDLSYQYTRQLDVETMQKAAAILIDYYDFTSFSKRRSQTKTNNCTISEAVWEEKNDLLIFTITADRFLRNMVRAIVGTLLEIGRGRLTVEDISKIIEAKNRNKAGFSVPAHALFLELIVYPYSIF